MFRVVMLVPTGVGAAIGGYAGDAGIVARYLGGCVDQIITHPNVVNAAMFNALPANGLYVEGQAINQFFLEKIGFQQVISNRIGIVIDRACEAYLPIIQNAVQATIMSTGCEVSGYCLTQEPVSLEIGAKGKVFAGQVNNFETLMQAAETCIQQGAQALAVLTWMDIVSDSQVNTYWQGQGADPIGALEALISHALVQNLKIPVAHSPIFAPQIVSEPLDPRVAAEEIGLTYLPCILMGLQRAPRFVNYQDSDFKVQDISALVVPATACGNVPVWVAAEQGIPVIAVAENATVLDIDFENMSLSAPHLCTVANYWEAAGLLMAMKQGVRPELLRRPLPTLWEELRIDTSTGSV